MCDDKQPEKSLIHPIAPSQYKNRSHKLLKRCALFPRCRLLICTMDADAGISAPDRLFYSTRNYEKKSRYKCHL